MTIKQINKLMGQIMLHPDFGKVRVVATIEKSHTKVIVEQIENRENRFFDRSEKWQESEKGEDFADVTFELQEKADELENLIDEIKNISF